MNAQEAIERLEELIEIITIRRDDYDHPSYEGGYAHEVPRLNEKIEALSIVLESARLFHEHTVPDLKRANLKFGRSEEYKTIYGVPLEKVGIELDKEKGVDE